METGCETTLRMYRGSPKFPRPAERTRRARSYLRKEDAHPNRKHKSVDHAFAIRSLSHTSFLIQIDTQEKNGSSLEIVHLEAGRPASPISNVARQDLAL